MSSKAFAGFLSCSLLVLASLPALAKSNVRIVRLSYVEGSVQIDRNTGKYEKAFSNLPIIEGAKLRAQSESRAEIEFEDGSTLRIVPNTTVQFPELSLEDSGAKLSTVEVLSGTAYVNFVGNKDNSISLVFGREKVALSKSAHLRVSVDEKGADLAVLKGEAQVEAPSGTTQVKKNQTATFDVAENKLALIKDVQELPFDAWDKQQGEYHERYNVNSYGNSSAYSYGMADLNYYGNFFSVPGYGMMWQPYFIGAGWDPFMDGAWALTPGYGFGWVSSYPWGWTPYHSGTWAFLPGYGWAWQPGGVWSPVYTPHVLNPPAGFTAPHAPTAGTTTVVMNRGPAPVNGLRGDKMVIRNNSAGLGVPRGEIKNLGKVSQQVQQRGEVTQRTHPAPVAMPAPSAMSTRPQQGPGPRSTPSASSRSSSPTRTSSGPSAPSRPMSMPSSGSNMPSAQRGGPSAPSGPSHR
jgi:hypothetical protein